MGPDELPAFKNRRVWGSLDIGSDQKQLSSKTSRVVKANGYREKYSAPAVSSTLRL
jgi:hypothetical protein